MKGKLSSALFPSRILGWERRLKERHGGKELGRRLGAVGCPSRVPSRGGRSENRVRERSGSLRKGGVHQVGILRKKGPWA